MFSNKKKNFFKSKWFYGSIVAFLLAFGIWVNYDTDSQKADVTTKVEQPTQTQQPTVVDSRGGETPGESSEGTTEESKKQQKTYYLIREIEGVVKVFYCNENGEESLYQITTVPFQLLSKEDQQLLAEGVRVENQRELADFLENFDS